MKREEVTELVDYIARIGGRVYSRRGRNNAVQPINFDGRPELRVLNMDPLQYQRLRKWTSPILHGQFEVVAVVPFTVNETESVHAKVVFEAGREMYAHSVGVDVLNAIAEAVDMGAPFVPR
jgi:hypothetical protein